MINEVVYQGWQYMRRDVAIDRIFKGFLIGMALGMISALIICSPFLLISGQEKSREICAR